MRLKKLDLLLIRSYIGPFIVTFFIATFVLTMQFFWLYMDELVGKGLGGGVIGQLLFYMSFTVMPTALPLAVLLSSIMTFGNMGEYYELVAIKSNGISLLRFMRPLFIFMIGISGLAFFVNNNLIPVANLKSLSLLYDLRNSKPTFNIRPGVFNRGIDGYAIRVGSKDEDGQTIRDVVIYDHTATGGGDKVVFARQGKMIPSAQQQSLVFRLQDGWRYQEGLNSMPWQQARHDVQVRMHFRQWDKVFDLSGMAVKRTDENLFKNAYQMLNISQLGHDIDSLKKTVATATNRSGVSLPMYFSGLAESAGKDKNNTPAPSQSPIIYAGNSFLSHVPDTLRNAVLARATGTVRNLQFQAGIAAQDIELTGTNLRKYQINWHQKLSLSISCLLMFLIGAPLGSIIRKGGLGLPMVVAILFFLLYYILSKSGELVAEAGSVPPWAGIWVSTAMLLPIAALLIQQARNDSQVFGKEWWLRAGGRIRLFFAGKKAANA